MSYFRNFTYSCDLCGAHRETAIYGGPLGFVYFHDPKSFEIKHCCKHCHKTLKDTGRATDAKNETKRIILAPGDLTLAGRLQIVLDKMASDAKLFS